MERTGSPGHEELPRGGDTCPYGVVISTKGHYLMLRCITPAEAVSAARQHCMAAPTPTMVMKIVKRKNKKVNGGNLRDTTYHISTIPLLKSSGLQLDPLRARHRLMLVQSGPTDIHPSRRRLRRSRRRILRRLSSSASVRHSPSWPKSSCASGWPCPCGYHYRLSVSPNL